MVFQDSLKPAKTFLIDKSEATDEQAFAQLRSTGETDSSGNPRQGCKSFSDISDFSFSPKASHEMVVISSLVWHQEASFVNH